MSLQWRMKLERAGLSCEVVHAEEAPGIPVPLGDLQFIARDVEWCALPAVRGLDLDKAFPSRGAETLDVVAGAGAILLRDPANLFGKVVATSLAQDGAFML